jgi:hypothetical protein
MSSRLLAIVILGVALAIGILWYTRADHIQPLASTPYDAGARAIEPSRADSSPRPKTRVRRLTKEQRAELAAQMRRATPQPAGSASLEPTTLVAAHESPDPAVRKFNDRALEELGGTQTYLAECFDKHRKLLPATLTVQTRVRIVTDPDVGAIVDAESLTDPAGQPLPAEFDSCIRDMLQTFALPPLPPTEDPQFLLALQLSFRDDDDTLEP